jgi:HlyD family secretion protein
MADAGREIDRILDAPSSSGWKGRARWLSLVLLLIGLAGAFALARRDGSDTATYVTDVVRRGDVAVMVTATGSLSPTTQIDVGSEISGIVARVLVEVNDRVAEGQPLAVIDTSRLRDAVASAEASLASSVAAVGLARATLDESRSQLDRLREVYRLSNGGVPSRADLSAQEAAVARALASERSAQANVAAARAQLSSNRTQLAKAVIRSPVAGVVLKRSIDPGQTVQAAFNTPSLFIIAEDLTRMKLEVSVDEADVGQVREGLDAAFTVDAYPGRTFPATITRVNLGSRNLAGGSSTSGSATSGVVSYATTLLIANDELLLRPGMTANATIRTAGARNMLLVPNAALRFVPQESTKARPATFTIRPPDARQATVVQERGIGVGSRQVVFVEQPDGSLRSVSVTTGPSDGRVTAVNSTELQAGMEVVTGQKARAGDG